MEDDRRQQKKQLDARRKQIEDLEKTREQEELRRQLEERRKERDAARRLYDNNFGNYEEDREEKDRRRKQRESDIQQKVSEAVKQKKIKGSGPLFVRSTSDAVLNPFRLFKQKMKATNRPNNVQNYFSDMLMKSPPSGEVARFFENFEDYLFDTRATFSNLPILYLDRFNSSRDLAAIVSLVDAQDSCGFTALHWAIQEGNIPRIEMLLANGARSDLKTFSAEHTALDKLKLQPLHVKSAVQELIQKYQHMNDDNSDSSNKGTRGKLKQHGAVEIREFPFLELPIELQVMVLEQLTVQNLTRIQRVCKYFKELQILPHRLTELPDMEVVTFGESRDFLGPQHFCQLTVMATPTVFHFGLIVGQKYKVPAIKGVDLAVHELLERIERFAKNDPKFTYNLEKLRNFLLSSCQSTNRRIYILEQTANNDNITIFVEEDSNFGLGVEFKSPPKGITITLN